jgi:hypothetical protein
MQHISASLETLKRDSAFGGSDSRITLKKCNYSMRHHAIASQLKPQLNIDPLTPQQQKSEKDSPGKVFFGARHVPTVNTGNTNIAIPGELTFVGSFGPCDRWMCNSFCTHSLTSSPYIYLGRLTVLSC